ncbi:LuxR C-terminal-related transcriptional regulator [Burkholderia multivorans]|uniref:helix-turn-helix transcriptional regulator n=1 Tax=Burkholderia multivorans TaxID=87883 RepID=UPI00143E575B|nr:LuxR C-terminal-related transcriptional regulator [Burkholderia multivorans]MBU9469037.1 LuxR C-terminal-related transcriptional regulator [Burkholderia multivorans]MCA8130049.1 LuxR C-terminal-related transcriptional regulator [Burkholderia multivorans]QIX14259.1 response regulator transcription factor [Burkholderia multivorans]
MAQVGPPGAVRQPGAFIERGVVEMHECELTNARRRERFAADSRFAEETIHFVARATGVSTVAFYFVDDDTGYCDFQRHDVPETFHRQYETGMCKYDPFELHRVALSDLRSATLTQRVGPCPEDQHYVRFLRAHGYTDAVEMVFRDEGRVVGGMSLLLHERDADATILSTVDAMQPYIEFNLCRMRGRGTPGCKREAAKHFLLSSREIDVVELLMQGNTNNDIASSLNISVATVKTHVMKIFHKVGVPNRSTLVSKLSEYGFH